MQGDPYRWGRATLEGYTPPADRPTEAPEPVIPLTALSSLDSPQSLEQAVRIDVPLAGDPASRRSDAGWVTDARRSGSTVDVRLRANGPGTAHVHVVDGSGVVGSRTVEVDRGTPRVRVPLSRAPVGATRVLVGWLDDEGGTLASAVRLR